MWLVNVDVACVVRGGFYSDHGRFAWVAGVMKLRRYLEVGRDLDTDLV
jgi:hypothetical protein